MREITSYERDAEWAEDERYARPISPEVRVSNAPQNGVDLGMRQCTSTRLLETASCQLAIRSPTLICAESKCVNIRFPPKLVAPLLLIFCGNMMSIDFIAAVDRRSLTYRL